MLLSEFESLTGIYPDSELYREIEQEYMDGDWKNKQGFCHDYKFNVNGLAEKIQRRTSEKIWKQEEKHRKAMTENSTIVQKLHEEITHLKKLLDTEQEWKPADHIGTNYDQKIYEELAESACGEELCDEAAKDTLSRMFGFTPERIEIVRKVCTYEVNRHGRFRIKQTFERRPVYASSDWNYIRFNCAGLQWEMIDGELVPYEN